MKHASQSTLIPVPPLLFWQTAILAATAGIVGARYPVFCLTIVMLLLWVDSRAWKPATALMLLLAAGCGMGIGFLADPMLASPHKPPLPVWLADALAQRKPVRISGTVLSVQGIPDRRLRIILEGVAPDSPPEGVTHDPLPGRLVWTWESPVFRPLPGQRISATFPVRPVRGFYNAGTSNVDAYWNSKGVFFQAWSQKNRAKPVCFGTPSLSAHLRETLRTAVWNNLPHTDVSAPAPTSGAALIPALLFGDRFSLTHTLTLRFQEAGLAHSLALSGQHLAVAGIIAWLFLKCIGHIAPRCFFHIPARYLFAALSVPPACMYLWLGDAPPSLLRASLMLLIWAICLWRGWMQMRATTLFDVLLLALTCILVIDPMSIYDLGLQLSFIAVAGISLATPVLRSLWSAAPFTVHPLDLLRTSATPALRFRAACTTVLRFFWAILGVSLAAQLATLPLALHTFGYSTFWFPLNLLWLPILGFIVLPAAFLGLFITGIALILPMPLASLMNTFAESIFHIAVFPCDALVSGLEWLHQYAGMNAVWGVRPHWTGILGFGAIFVAFAISIGRVRLPASGKRLLLAGFLLLLIGPGIRLFNATAPHINLRVLDVGQGQAVLLEWPPTPPDHVSLWERQCSSAFLFQSQGLSRQKALIDGGGFFSNRFDTGRDVIRPVLAANQHPDLTFVAVTHPDRDHLRGLLFLSEHFHPEAALTAPFSENATSHTSPLAVTFLNILEQNAIPRRIVSAGDTIPLTENCTLQIVAPPTGVIPTGNNGLLLRLDYNGYGLALIPGDAEAPYLRTVLRACAGTKTPLDADVLVLPHHGSASSLVPAFYDAVQPELAIASVGAYNSYGLPAASVREALIHRDIPLYSTAEHGEITIQWMPHENGLPQRTLTINIPEKPFWHTLFHEKRRQGYTLWD